MPIDIGRDYEGLELILILSSWTYADNKSEDLTLGGA